jgi:hypothetical protein
MFRASYYWDQLWQNQPSSRETDVLDCNLEILDVLDCNLEILNFLKFPKYYFEGRRRELQGGLKKNRAPSTVHKISISQVKRSPLAAAQPMTHLS